MTAAKERERYYFAADERWGLGHHFDLLERLGRLSGAELEVLAYPWLHRVRAYFPRRVHYARLEQDRRLVLDDEEPVGGPWTGQPTATERGGWR